MRWRSTVVLLGQHWEVVGPCWPYLLEWKAIGCVLRALTQTPCPWGGLAGLVGLTLAYHTGYACRG